MIRSEKISTMIHRRVVLRHGRFARVRDARHVRFDERLRRACNPMIQAAEMSEKLRALDPDLYWRMFYERFDDVSSCFVVRSWEVPAIGATHGEVYFYPTDAFLQFLAAFRAMKGV